jgi:ketosteroid isomerase-like protein
VVASTSLAILCTGCIGPLSGSAPASAETVVGGIPIRYDVAHADLAETRELFERFVAAYVARDAPALERLLSRGFVWHLHETADGPGGFAVHGVDGLIAVLRQRDARWTELVYSDISVHATAGLITQTYRVRGVDPDTGPFDRNGVDLYTVEDGRLSTKDSYWKIRRTSTGLTWSETYD